MIDMEKIEKALQNMSFSDTLELAEHLGWVDPEQFDDEDPDELQADAIDHIIYTLKFPSKLFEEVEVE